MRLALAAMSKPLPVGFRFLGLFSALSLYIAPQRPCALQRGPWTKTLFESRCKWKLFVLQRKIWMLGWKWLP